MKRAGHNVISERYFPSKLPSEGERLESFIPSDYSMNDSTNVKRAYVEAKERLNSLLLSCDIYSIGNEADFIIDSQIEHIWAEHNAQCAHIDHQITRINSAIQTRREEIQRKLKLLQETVKVLSSDIEPLKDLEPQFRIRLGHRSVSIGLLVTILAMIIDGFVNYSFLSEVLIQNAALLTITVFCMSICSDGCMWGLAVYLNHRKEDFTEKPVFWMVCAGFLGAFLLSVIASFMIRYGSMDTTFGSIGANGEVIPKAYYTLADYGITLFTSFVTTATGFLSFGFSLDKNIFRISIRERKEAELKRCLKEINSLQNELALLDNAPDPAVRDAERRKAAVRQIEALRVGLKVCCRELLAEHFQNADFTQAMSSNGEQLLAMASPAFTRKESIKSIAAAGMPSLGSLS